MSGWWCCGVLPSPKDEIDVTDSIYYTRSSSPWCMPRGVSPSDPKPETPAASRGESRGDRGKKGESRGKSRERIMFRGKRSSFTRCDSDIDTTDLVASTMTLRDANLATLGDIKRSRGRVDNREVLGQLRNARADLNDKWKSGIRRLLTECLAGVSATIIENHNAQKVYLRITKNLVRYKIVCGSQVVCVWVTSCVCGCKATECVIGGRVFRCVCSMQEVQMVKINVEENDTTREDAYISFFLTDIEDISHGKNSDHADEFTFHFRPEAGETPKHGLSTPSNEHVPAHFEHSFGLQQALRPGWDQARLSDQFTQSDTFRLSDAFTHSEKGKELEADACTDSIRGGDLAIDNECKGKEKKKTMRIIFDSLKEESQLLFVALQTLCRMGGGSRLTFAPTPFPISPFLMAPSTSPMGAATASAFFARSLSGRAKSPACHLATATTGTPKLHIDIASLNMKKAPKIVGT